MSVSRLNRKRYNSRTYGAFTINGLFNDFIKEKSEDLQKKLTRILGQTISILDPKAKNEEKENFYHGLLLGLLRSWDCKMLSL